MRLGVMADVHSNLHALRVALEVLSEQGVDEIFFAGDAVGYGAFPNDCCRMIHDACHKAVRGNHDDAVIKRRHDGMNPYAVSAVNWTIDVLHKESSEYLDSLPMGVHEEANGTTVAMYHGSPDDLHEYIHEDSARGDMLNAVGADILILGHTHMPFVKRFDGGMILNPGSVGQPRDRDPRGSIAIVDLETRDCEIKRFDYPFDEAGEAIIECGLPLMLAERLKIGW